jgi:phosphoglucosamine mutase
VLASIVETGRRASEVCRLFTPVPQRLRSVRFGEGDPLASIPVKRAIDDGKDRLGAAGRLVIRKSGTEPMIRVMAEGEDEELVAAVVDEICEAILHAAAGAEDDRPRIARLGSAQAAE